MAKAVYPVIEDLGDSTGQTCHHWSAACHGLGDRKSERFRFGTGMNYNT